MFIEPNFRSLRSGWIEVIVGCMFSGKTEELIRRVRRAKIANLQVQVFKPMSDDRYSIHEVTSHNRNIIPSFPIKKSSELLTLARELKVIGIDEAQFFDEELPTVCDELAADGIRVIIAGLDLDYKALPFGPMPTLMSIAEYVTKVHAICIHCGNLAHYSYRKSEEEDVVVLGEGDKYEPRCRRCYSMGNILDYSPPKDISFEK